MVLVDYIGIFYKFTDFCHHTVRVCWSYSMLNGPLRGVGWCHLVPKLKVLIR